jgi:hypothetical protein
VTIQPAPQDNNTMPDDDGNWPGDNETEPEPAPEPPVEYFYQCGY